MSDERPPSAFHDETAPAFDDRARLALDRLRSFCLMLPETKEIQGFGGLPTFRVAVKSYATFEVVDGRPTVTVKLAPPEQAELLRLDGYWPEPETGDYGWTQIDVAKIGWATIDELVIASYRLIAPAEFVRRLDGLLTDD